MLLSEQAYKDIDKEISKFPIDKKQSAIIAALAIAQKEKNWLSNEIIEEVANYLNIPAIKAQEIATFYNMFNTLPVGKYKISICTNLPCALRGSKQVANYICKRLNTKFKEITKDNKFSVIETECMGACGDAPVILINNQNMHIKMTEEKIDSLLNKLDQDEA
ncbi:NADH-quinone oxidoreductase subunit 2 [Candidatus Kinetoplastibacterium sorsogonicusi]|uniref:NADH-quinone oxidoreductase subunit 2 n=1 Tax=Candidatus Kinetoplastidibacterium kentomonadis TaxID=1576550 RepID=A0A3Q8EYB0_9PROT|nr:NADH-quinone oxidoreductase subunit NuoE [Candidatus Kinetoplastibacterium sorsogonicusi]AWD32592.1 NADH-quinone oxidoreductase subunit 2 [Candidatus Kinetoplastibacterium sorsogonicusi]